MRQYPALRRALAGGAAVAVMGVVVVLAATSLRPLPEQPAGKPDPKQPWPMWGGRVSRNQVNTFDTNVPTDWDVGKKVRVLWVEELGSKAYGGPVIGDGKVFIGTNNEKPRDPKYVDPKTKKPIDMGVLMCFDEKTGKFQWQLVHAKLPAGRVQDWPLEGICSTPAIEGDKLYYVSNDCKLHCVTTAGKVVWTLDMIKDLDVFPHNLSTSSPLVVGDMVFVITSNGVNENHIDVPAPAAPSFIAVNKAKGNVVWKNNDPTKNLLAFQKGGKAAPQNLIKSLVNKGELIMHGQWSSPVYAEVGGAGQIIFPGGDGWIRSFDPKNGNEIWRFDCNPKESKYALGGKGTRNDFVSTPVVHDGKLYIGVGQDPEHDEGVGHFYCIDVTKKGDVSIRTRKEKDKNGKEIQVEVYDSKDPINKDSALVWHYGGENSKKELLGEIKGRSYVFGRTLSTAAVHDGLVYIAELAGYLHCLDAKTGQQYWVHNVDAPIWASPYWVDGKVYMGTDGNEVLIFKHGKQKNLIATVPMDGMVRATPVVANGVLYVMTESKLYAIK
jgi:outer membrane protein assembly factor BamB